MEHLCVGLLILVLGNLIWLERTVAGQGKDIKHIKKRLESEQ